MGRVTRTKIIQRWIRYFGAIIWISTFFPFVQRSNSSAILPAHLLLKAENSKVSNPSSINSFSDRTKWKHQRLKPSDDLDLPILPFHYPSSRDKLPQESDLDPRVLTLALGLNFDPEFMSINRPLESIRHPNGTYFYDTKIFGGKKYKGDGSNGKTRSDLSLLQHDDSTYRITPFVMPGLPGVSFHIQNKKRRQQFEKYLAALTFCPVRFKWKDLGPRFWPRWMKEGSCKDSDSGGSDGRKGLKKKGNNVRKSCSIPAGMTCGPKKSTTRTLLWWHCRVATKSNQKMNPQCSWINIKYPIITQCKCSCK